MSTAILLALHLVTQQTVTQPAVTQQTRVEVRSSHPIVQVEGRHFYHLAPGARLEATVRDAKAAGQVWIDVARMGARSGKRAGLGRLRVDMDGQSRTVRVRLPLVTAREVDSERLSSQLKSTALLVLSDASELTLAASETDSDLLVAVEINNPRRDRPPVLRMPSGASVAVAPDAAAGAAEPSPAPVVPAAEQTTSAVPPSSPSSPSATAPTLVEAHAYRTADQGLTLRIHATGTDSDADVVALRVRWLDAEGRGVEAIAGDRFALDAPVHGQGRFVAQRTFPRFFASGGGAVQRVEVALEDAAGQRSASVTAVLEPMPDASATEPAPVPSQGARATGLAAATGWPLALYAEVGAGAQWQVAGGLQPIVLAGQLRAGARALHPTWSRYSLGLGVDFLQQAAASPGSGPGAPLRWNASETRVRLELGVRVIEPRATPWPAAVTIFGGVGATVGRHDVVLAGKAETRTLLGPTARVGARVDIPLGPGAVSLSVPFDVTVDNTSGVSGYGPLSIGPSAGYRLEF